MSDEEMSQVDVEPVESSEPTVSAEATPAEPSSGDMGQDAGGAPASVWDAFKSLPDFEGQEDRAIAEALYGALQRQQEAAQAIERYQQVLPVAREYLTHRDKFREYMNQQSAPQQQPIQQPVVEEPEEPKWWNPPAVRESYKRFLVRDENGREVIAEDAPLEAKHELYEYQQYKAEFAQKFLADPQQALGPMVEKIAQQKAREIVDSQFTDYNNQQYVSSLEEENKDWLYDESGKPTEEGIAIQRYIAEAAQMGIRTIDDRWKYATNRLTLELREQIEEAERTRGQRAASARPDFSRLLDRASPRAPQESPQMQTSPAQNQAEKDIEYLRREASRNPSRASSSPDPRIPQGRVSFQDRLAAALAKNGLA